MAELRLHVHAELAERDGVVVIDPNAFPKKGTGLVASPVSGVPARQG